VIPLYVLAFFGEREVVATETVLFCLPILGLFDLVYASLGATGQEQLASTRGFDVGRAAPFGYHQSSNAFAQVLAMVIVSALAGLVSGGLRKKSLRVLSWAALGAGSVGITVTGSREGLVGALAGIVWLIWGTRGETGLRRSIVRIAFATAIMCVALLFAQGFIGRFTHVFKRASAIVQSRSLMADENFSGRVGFWRESVAQWVSEPSFVLTGRGQRSVGEDVEGIGFTRNDNAYLDAVNVFGILGLVAMLWLIVRFWRMAVTLSRSASGARLSAIGMQTAIVVYCLMGFAGNVLGSPLTTMVFLTIVGLGIVRAVQGDRPRFRTYPVGGS
jgi:hypothetical protein